MLKKILRVFVSLLILALLVAIGVTFYLQFADFNRYKPEISQRLTEYLGRPVVLTGDFNIKILPPSLSLNEASIANASWGSTPNMLSVQSLDLQLRLLPLLSGKLLISEFVLDDVQVVVEHNEQGDSNWQLLESKLDKPKAKPMQQSTALPLDFASDVNIDIKNITLSYCHSPVSQSHEFILNKAAIQGLGGRDALQIDIAGQIDSDVYQITGQIGSLANLLSADESYPVDLQAYALNTSWKLEGTIQNVLKLGHTQLNVKVNTEDLTAWQPWLGFRIQHGPVNINADIDGNVSNLALSNLSVQFGRATAKGNIALDMSAEKPVVTARLDLNDIHTEDFIDAIQPASEKKSEPAPPPIQTSAESSELDLSILERFDSSLTLSVSSIGFRDWMVDQFDAELSVKDGRLSVAPFSVKSKLGQANGQFSLGIEQGMNVAKLDIDAKELVLGKFYKMHSTYQGIGGLQGEIHTQGKSWMAMYANLQGNATAHYVNNEHKHDTKIALRRDDPKDSTAPFEVVIDGELLEVPYTITGEIGGPMALIEDTPYPATANLKFLNVEAKAKGTIAQLFQAKGFDIAFDAHTEDLAKVNQQINIGLPDLEKAQVQTVLRGDYLKLRFEKIHAKSNSAALSGNIQLDFTQKPLNIGGDLIINKFDLAGVQKELESAHKAKSVQSVKSQESAFKKAMSFSALQAFNMDIRLGTDKKSSINVPRIPISNFNTRLFVAHGALLVEQLKFESPMGEMISDIKIEAKYNVPVVEARLVSSDIDLAQLEVEGDEFLLREASARADIALRTQGDTLQHWLEYVTGSVALNYQHKQLSQTYVLRLVREAQADVRTAPVSVHINTKIGETTSQGLGKVSAPYTWLQGGPPTNMDFAMNVKGYDAQVQGEIDDLVSGDGMDVRVSFNNRRLLTGTFDPNDVVNKLGKVQLLMVIKGNYSSIVASQLDGVVGKGKITGSASVNFREQPAAVDFDLNIDDLDISKWAWEDTKSSTSQTKPEKLFSNYKLPFNALKAATMKGKIDGDNIQFKRVLATKLVAAIDLRDGVLKFDLRRLLTNQGELSADLDVDSNETPPKLTLKLDVPTLNMAEFARNTAAEGLIKGDFSADFSLNTAGDSIAELAAGMDGYVRVLMGKGTIDSTLLNIYAGGFSAMVGMVTAANVKSTNVNCGICGLQFTKGKGVSEVVLLDTQHSTLVAEGWIDLASETLSVKASPVKKGLRLNTELPLVVQGKLSDPKLSTQPTSALNTAAEIATVWFIPTTAIFIAYDGLRSGDNNPCVNMVAPTKDGAALRALKGAGKAVEDLGSVFSKGLSKLLGGAVEQNPREKNSPQ